MNSYTDTEKFKKAELREYPSMKAVAEATGLPIKLLKMAKLKGWKGFHASSRIDWRTLKPVFEKEIEELLTEPLSLKDQSLQKDIKLKELQIKKLERNLIEPEDVKSLLVEIATNQSVTIKKSLSELPPKLVGLSEPEIKELIDKATADIFKALKEAELKVDGLTS